MKPNKSVAMVIAFLLVIVATAIAYQYRGVLFVIDCEDLSLAECSAVDHCVGRWGSSCNGAICTGAYNFYGCAPSGLTADEFQQIKTECDKLNGEFKKNAGSEYECHCDEPHPYCLQSLINELQFN